MHDPPYGSLFPSILCKSRKTTNSITQNVQSLPIIPEKQPYETLISAGGARGPGKPRLTSHNQHWKSFILQTDGKVVVLSADMRLQPGKALLDVLFGIANQTVQEMSTKSEYQPYLAPVMGTFAAILSVAENIGAAATPIANFVTQHRCFEDETHDVKVSQILP